MSERNSRHRLGRRTARRPEEVLTLLIERSNIGDLDGVVELYADDAVVAYPPGETTYGRAAIRAVWSEILSRRPALDLPTALVTLRRGDVALTTTAPEEGGGHCAQVLRREAEQLSRPVDEDLLGGVR